MFDAQWHIPFLVRVSGQQCKKLDNVVVHYAVKLFTFFTAKLRLLRGELAKKWVSKFGSSSTFTPFLLLILKSIEARERERERERERDTHRTELSFMLSIVIIAFSFPSPFGWRPPSPACSFHPRSSNLSFWRDLENLSSCILHNRF